MFKKVIEEINKFNRIIIHRHSRPDGDALGSQYGLALLILNNFENKKVYMVGDTTNRYDFICSMDEIPDSFYDDALCFVLDCSEEALISDERYKNAKEIIKIDHHVAKNNFGQIEIIDDTFESCAGLIAYMAIEENLKITSDCAKAFFTGIVTDSGRFRYDSSTARTFMVASKLLEKNFDVNEIYNNLYNEDLEMIRLRAKFVLKMQFTKKNVAYIITTKEEVRKENVDVFTISRGMVNTMAGIKGIDIWANFTEDENGIIAELRSSKYNINPIATKYGGGGHMKASGATLKSFDDVYKMLEDLDELVK